jgi:glucosamine--fructose-6-phosphate aminotransferase (isomerizing)
MCGIVAYIGEKEAFPIVLKGLKRLEYRGYDSSGIAINNNLNLNLFKKQGKVAELEKYVEGVDTSGNIGIGHTRWATHGEPNDVNAHPHLSGNGKFALVHNGIIENYAILKKELISRGHEFKSETDTEVLMHLIEDVIEKENVDLFEGVRQALHEVHGAYAIVVISEKNTQELIAARKSSP